MQLGRTGVYGQLEQANAELNEGAVVTRSGAAAVGDDADVGAPQPAVEDDLEHTLGDERLAPGESELADARELEKTPQRTHRAGVGSAGCVRSARPLPRVVAVTTVEIARRGHFEGDVRQLSLVSSQGHQIADR